MVAQVSYDVRFEWGPTGAAALAPSSMCLVVVDVLSFSTSVTVAAEAGTRVYPCAWPDESAAGGRGGAAGAAGPVTVIAAGERWPDGSLRPALEGLLGAGAILAALRDPGGPQDPYALRDPRPGIFSPEAEAARTCFEATAHVAAAVSGCASGRELIEGGFGDDVGIAVEIDTCQLVPVLADGAFTAATGQERA